LIEKDEFSSRFTLPALKKERTDVLINSKDVADKKFQDLESEITDLEGTIEKHKQRREAYTKIKAKIEKAIEFRNNLPPQKSTEKAAKTKGKRKLKEPNIISVSRRTDIPALYSEWFFNRIKEGSVIYRKDTETKPKEVSLAPENVRCFVFWTKNPGPMLDRLDELKGYHYFFHFTLTPYGHDLEPHLPPNEKLIETFIRLSEAIGKQKVIWRYDPILLTDTIDAGYHRKNFADLAERLHKHTDKCIISFISSLGKISEENKGILKLRKTSDDVRLALAKDIYQIAQGYGLKVEACSQELDYTSVGIPRSRCVDPDLVGTLIGKQFKWIEDPSQRKNCGCSKSVDIGMDWSCVHGCIYCYATKDHKQAKVNYGRHDKNSPLLIGKPEDRDVHVWEIKNNEWTKSKNNVNFSSGCSNNCLYCYGRYMPFARKKEQEAKEHGKEWHWGEPIIREKDVQKKQSLRDGRVGFPTSHDITPGNLDASLTVLGNLLNAGNEVMIISKPRLSCVEAICRAYSAFKDKILFRFTIGGKSEDVLKFWEPYAPTYEERLEALKYAFNNGFQTSVSMEPMLEYSRAQEMVDDFMPYVRDAIWFGKMNHIPLFEDPDGRLKEELAKVEAGHADENIKALYEIYKDNPKIKWKLAFKKVLDIPLPPAPGMDL
jgi:DNA repair photolyase